MITTEDEDLELVLEEIIEDRFRLRDYQDASVDALRENIRKGIKNQVLCAPTGSGKTVMAAHLVKACYELGKHAIFVADRISLIDQTSAFFDSYGIPHGVIQSNHWRRKPGERVQVASAQTLIKRGWPAADLIIIDECHAISKTVVDRITPRDTITIGLTATPFSRGMGRYYDAVVTVTTNNKLTDEGYLSKFRVFNASSPNMSNAKTVAGEWSDADCSKAAIPIIGDCVAQYLKHGNGQKFIAFGCDVAHCEEMQRQFIAAGIVAQLYTYQTGDEERSEFVKEFRKDTSYIRGLISVSALAKGFDVPDVGVIIMCRPLKSSLAEHIQILGRGLRPHECKREHGCVILDHAGNMERFWPEMSDFFENSIHELDDGKKKEKKKPKPDEKKAVKCPKCSHVFGGGPICPECGFACPKREAIKHEAGELHEWTAETATKDDKARIYGELKYYAKMKFYKEGWAANQFRKFFGVWPNSYRDAPEIPPSAATKKRIAKTMAAWFLKQKRAPNAEICSDTGTGAAQRGEGSSRP